MPDDQKLQADGQLDEEDRIEKIYSNLRSARNHFSTRREEIRENYNFYAGKQWSEEDKTALLSDMRQPIVFNRIARNINAIIGLEVQNRQELRYYPMQDNGQGGYPEAMNHGAKWVRSNCDAEDEESQSFQDDLIAGIGWTETRIDYDEDPEGKIYVDRIDPLEMLYDPNAKKSNCLDSNWVARIKRLTKDEFESLWPDADTASMTSFWQLEDDTEASRDRVDNYAFGNDNNEKTLQTKFIDVIQYQAWERVDAYKVTDNNGAMIALDKDKFDQLKDYLDAMGYRYIKYRKKVYRETFLGGKTILEEKELGCDHFTFQAMTGFHDRNDNVFFGLVDLMKDPQRWANKFLSQVLHIVNTGAKTGINIEESAITGSIQKFAKDYAKPGSISVYADGALRDGRVQPKTPSPYPDGVDRLLQFAIESINDVTGVNLEMIGMTGRDQPIGLEESRKQAGLTIIATFFDSLRRYRKNQGRLLAYFIREYISDGRLIRIVGPTGAQYVPLMKDDVSFKYDIIVDDAPTSPNMREKTFMILSQIIPMVLTAGIPIPPDILDFIPMPEDLTQKWKQLILKNQEDQTAEQMKQLALVQAHFDTQKTQSEITLNNAKAEQAHAIGQDEGAQAMQKMGMAHADFQAKQTQTQNQMATMLQQHAMKMQMQNQQFQADQQRQNTAMLLDQRRKQFEAEVNAEIKRKQISMQSKSNR
jgi:hypothetical protein